MLDYSWLMAQSSWLMQTHGRQGAPENSHFATHNGENKPSLPLRARNVVTCSARRTIVFVVQGKGDNDLATKDPHATSSRGGEAFFEILKKRINGPES